MTKERRDKLIVGGKAGMLNAREQDELACELEVYRDMAIRMEQSLHEIVKEMEAKAEAFK